MENNKTYDPLFKAMSALSGAGAIYSYVRYYKLYDERFGTNVSHETKPSREQLLKMAADTEGTWLSDALLEAANRPEHLRDSEMPERRLCGCGEPAKERDGDLGEWCDGMGELPRARTTNRLCNLRLSLSDLRHELAKLRGEK